MWTYVVSFLVVNKYGLIYLSYCVSLLITFVAGFLSVSWFFGTEVSLPRCSWFLALRCPHSITYIQWY